MPRAKKAVAVVETAPEETTVSAVTEIETIGVVAMPLARLMLSDMNVRRHERDAFVAELAENIAAKGLKQNLIVVPCPAIQPGDWPDHEVIAGGRRFQALKLLEERGVLPADFSVPVLIETDADATSTSLSENLYRVPMNPVDELMAYRKVTDDIMYAEGVSMSAAIETCARRFGKTVRHIEQRLRLAALAEPILNALRDRLITLDAARVYAATADQDAQMQAWHSLIEHARGEPRAIREALAKTTIASNDRIALFVGRDAYVAAGGLYERDLFAVDGVEIWSDRGLINRLALEKLNLFGEEFKGKKIAEVRSILTDYVTYADYQDLHHVWGRPAANQAEKIIRFVLIDKEGNAAVADQVFSLVREAAGAVTSDDGSPKAMSQSLIDLCALERRDVLAAALCGHADLASDLMLFVMAKGMLGGTYGAQHCVGIKFERQGDLVKGWEPNSLAGEYLKGLRASLDEGWLSAGDAPEQFLAFRQLDAADKERWMLYCMAQSLQACAFGAKAGFKTDAENRFFDVLGTLADIDVRSWYTPTAENYFKRLPTKDALVTCLNEMGSEDTAAWKNAKKGEIAAECERVAQFHDPVWVPAIMGFPTELPEIMDSEADDVAASVDEVDQAA